MHATPTKHATNKQTNNYFDCTLCLLLLSSSCLAYQTSTSSVEPRYLFSNLLSTTGALYVLCAHNTCNSRNKQTNTTMSTTCSARCSSPPQSSCLASLTSTFSVAPRFRFCIPSFVLVNTDRNSLRYDVLLQVRRQQSSAMSLIFTQPNSSLCRNGCS